MPRSPRLSEALEASRTCERLVELEFSWAFLYCAVIEWRQYKRVPILPNELIDFILDTMPDNLMSVPYPGRHYGKPRDTINEL